MTRARKSAGRWIAEHTTIAIVLAGIPSLVAGLIGVVAKRLDVSPDRVFLLIGLLTFASGLLTIVVLFIRYIVNDATLTSAVSSTAPHGIPRLARARMTSCLSCFMVQPSITAVRSSLWRARAGGVLKRSSERTSWRPMASTSASKGSALSGGSIR